MRTHELKNSVAIVVDGAFKHWYHAPTADAADVYAKGVCDGAAFGAGVDLWAVIWAHEGDDLRKENQKAYDDAVAAFRKEQDGGEDPDPQAA